MLCRTEFEGFSIDETVRVVMSGNQEPKSVDITETAMEKGAEVCGWCCHVSRCLLHCISLRTLGLCVSAKD